MILPVFQLTASGFDELPQAPAPPWASGATLLVRFAEWRPDGRDFVGAWRGIYLPDADSAQLLVLLHNRVGDSLWLPVPLRSRRELPALCYAERGGMVAAPESWPHARERKLVPTVARLLDDAVDFELAGFPSSPFGLAARRLLKVANRWRGAAGALRLCSSEPFAAAAGRLIEAAGGGGLPEDGEAGALLHRALVRASNEGTECSVVLRDPEVAAWWEAVARTPFESGPAAPPPAPTLRPDAVMGALVDPRASAAQRGRALGTLARWRERREVEGLPAEGRAALLIARTRGLAHGDRARWESSGRLEGLEGPKRLAISLVAEPGELAHAAAAFLLLRSPFGDATLRVRDCQGLLSCWLTLDHPPDVLDRLGLALVLTAHRLQLAPPGEDAEERKPLAEAVVEQVGRRASAEALPETMAAVVALEEFVSAKLTLPSSKWRYNVTPELVPPRVPTEPVELGRWVREYGLCPRPLGLQHWPTVLDRSAVLPERARWRMYAALRAWCDLRAPQDAPRFAQLVADRMHPSRGVPTAPELALLAEWHPSPTVAAEAWLDGFRGGATADAKALRGHILTLLKAPIPTSAAVRQRLDACLASSSPVVAAAALRLYGREHADVLPVAELLGAVRTMFGPLSAHLRSELSFADPESEREGRLRTLRDKLATAFPTADVAAALRRVADGRVIRPPPAARASAGSALPRGEPLPWPAEEAQPDFSSLPSPLPPDRRGVRARLDATLLERLGSLDASAWREALKTWLGRAWGGSDVTDEWRETLRWAVDALHDHQHLPQGAANDELIPEELGIRHAPALRPLGDTDAELLAVVYEESERFGLSAARLEGAARVDQTPHLEFRYIRMILRNLLLNAADHVKRQGGVSVTVTSVGVLVANPLFDSAFPVVRYWHDPPKGEAPGHGMPKIRRLVEEHTQVVGAAKLRIVPWLWREGPEARPYLGLELHWGSGFTDLHHDFNALYAPWRLVGPVASPGETG